MPINETASPWLTNQRWNNFTQPQITPVSQQQHSNGGGFITIFVNNEDEVNNYPVAAGLTVILISFNLKKFWLKGTDTSGIPNQLRTFDFEEKTPVQNQNAAGIVTRDEFDSLCKRFDKLLSELGGVKNE